MWLGTTDSRGSVTLSLNLHFSSLLALRIHGYLHPLSLSSFVMTALILGSVYLRGEALGVWVIGFRRFGTASLLIFLNWNVIIYWHFCFWRCETKLYLNALTSHPVLQCQFPEERWRCVYRCEGLRNRRFDFVSNFYLT